LYPLKIQVRCNLLFREVASYRTGKNKFLYMKRLPGDAL
jgi:hypothetical protein